MIDWTDPQAMVSKHFKVSECTYLPSWKVSHTPSDAEKVHLIAMAAKMDVVRELLGKPINIHVWIRPTLLTCPDFDPTTVTPETDAQRDALAALNYNAYVGGAGHSAHVLGLAVDWDCGENCDHTRSTLEPKLEELGLRMERKPGGPWVHLDIMPVPAGGHRYFNP